MAKREEYNQCMRPFITGAKEKEQRKLDFCIGAKVCSRKAKDRAEAERLCLLPKEPKPMRARKDKQPVSCKEEMITLAQCMVAKIDMNLVSSAKNIETALVDALLKCQCHR